MHIGRKLSILLAGIFLFAACKKDSSNTVTKPDECVSGNAAQNGEIIEGRFIVMYDPSDLTTRNVTEGQLASLAEDVVTSNEIALSAVKANFGGDFGGFVADLSQQEVSRLRGDGRVKAIEPDRVIALANCFTVVEPRLITWNIHRVGYGNGLGKVAWIIDTGIDFDHPDLNVDQARSRTFITNTTNADDEHGHGTHVAGVIGGKNNTFGVLGVASGASVVSLRVLNAEGTGSVSAIIQALAYINANGKAGDVVNMSLGDDEGGSTILDQQVLATAAKGIYISIAAGNDSRLASSNSPARVNGTNIYTVSAIDSTDNFASFSNFGNDAVDYAAPGVRIVSTYKDGKYAIMSGTSMAAPHLAGLLLLKGRNITTSGTAKNDPDGTPDPIAHF